MAQLTRGIGKLLQIGVAKETSRGTAKTVASYWIQAEDWSIDERFSNVVQLQSFGIIEDNVAQTRVKNWAEGQLKFPISGTSSGIFFHALFGSSNAVLHAGETLVYDHTFEILESAQHPTLTLFIHDPIATPGGATADYAHANAVVHKLDLEYSLGNFVMGTASLKALTGVVAGSAYTPTATIEDRFVPQHLTFKVAGQFSGIAGASAIKIKSAKISIDEMIEDDDVLGSTSPRDFLNKEFAIEGTIEAIWQNESDFKTNALANTAQAMQLDLVNSSVTLGNAANPQFTLKLYKVHFTEFSRPIKIKDVVYQTVKFKAAYDTTNAVMARIVLTNTVPQAY